MATQAKKQYTPDQETVIIEAIEDVTTYPEQTIVIEELTEVLGKTKRSITAKISSLAKAGKCKFIRKADAVKTESVAGGNSADKADIVQFIADAIGADVGLIETLEKANKTALLIVFKALNEPVYEQFSEDITRED